MRLSRFIAATISYQRGLAESEDDPEYIDAAQAVFIARDSLLKSGFIQVGRSNKSEACYLARPGSTWLRIRCAAHDPVHSASTEGVVTSLIFVNRYTDDVKEWGDIDGERIEVGTRRVKHTGLDQDDIDELVQEAIETYDAARDADDERTTPLASA